MLNPVFRNTRSLVSAVIGVALLGLTGCSSTGEEAVKPNPLPDYKQEVKLKTVWNKGVGNGQEDSWLHLMPVVDGDRIYAAGTAGEVSALDKATGKQVWSVDLDTRITGGVGAGEGLILVGTRDGRVIALSEVDGAELWTAPVTSEVLSVPQIQNGVVVTQAIDAKLIGLDAKDGKRLWQQEVLQPVLTLRGTSSPRIANGVVYAGFANGEARAYRLDTGIQLWDAKVAVPRGSSELERMVDVDSAPLVSGDRLYMVSYQGNVVSLDRDGGRVLWARESSSYESITEGFGNIYLSDSGSTVSAVDQRTGAIVWSQKDFANRGLSGPSAVGSYVVAGDFEGYLHVISQVDGRIVGRTKVDSSGIRSRPLVVDDVIYVYTNGGDLAALKIQ